MQHSESIMDQQNTTFHQAYVIFQCKLISGETFVQDARMIARVDDHVVFEWPIGSHCHWRHYKILLWLWQISMDFEQHLGQDMSCMDMTKASSCFQSFDGIVRRSPNEPLPNEWLILIRTVDDEVLLLDMNYDYGQSLLKISDDQAEKRHRAYGSKESVFDQLNIESLAVMIENTQDYAKLWIELCLARHAHCLDIHHQPCQRLWVDKTKANPMIVQVLNQSWWHDDTVQIQGALIDQCQHGVRTRCDTMDLHSQSMIASHPQKTKIDAWTAHQLISLNHNAVIPFKGMRKELKRLCSANPHFGWKMPYHQPLRQSKLSWSAINKRLYKDWYTGPDDHRLVLFADNQASCQQCQLGLDANLATLIDRRLPDAVWPGHRWMHTEHAQLLPQYHGLKCRDCQTRCCWTCLIQEWILASTRIMDRDHRVVHCFECPCQNVIVPWQRLWPIVRCHLMAWHTIDHAQLTVQQWIDLVMPISVANMIVWQKLLHHPELSHQVNHYRIVGLLSDQSLTMTTLRANNTDKAKSWLDTLVNLSSLKVDLQICPSSNVMVNWPIVSRTLGHNRIDAWLASDACPQCGMDPSQHHDMDNDLFHHHDHAQSSQTSMSNPTLPTTIILSCPCCHSRYCRVCRTIISDNLLVNHLQWSWLDCKMLMQQFSKKWNGQLSVLRNMPGSCQPLHHGDRQALIEFVKHQFVNHCHGQYQHNPQ